MGISEAACEGCGDAPRGNATKKTSAIGSIAKLYKTPLPSTRTGPLYNAFSYPTKISPEAIAVYIAAHTEPGAAVLDAFGGSGTTGIAALLCDRPTPEMMRIADSLGVQPRWGPRHAHLFEIGVLGSFVSETLCHPPEPEAFAHAVDELCQQGQEKLGWLYEAKDEMGRKGVLRHAIWSDVLVCPHCKTEVSLWDASVKTKPLAMVDSFFCKGCHKQVAVEACERATEVAVDAFGRRQISKKRVVARIHGRNGSIKWQRPPTEEDRELVARIADTKPPKSAPCADIQWGELRRAGYHLGIDKLHHSTRSELHRDGYTPGTCFRFPRRCARCSASADPELQR
ncbi:DNA methyltransferase [Acidithiobacillus ferrooxidans]|uniref:DNA methyltransferase n=1 Tax=Acidithiobacillus ferrooxidans TaxID=920 RepID=UPI001C0753D8|nr:DNA methyltransferase [Acidithiobacillus ferrooxidans]